ncbi:SDR family NAD(P)-dependent oxidoreductase [Paenibacillus sp. FSL R10-2736]|uniref:SDR family NAD(P)-dependent oxidoreductase n=1 Tax=Paenibacillus sp. FSL R10-2736 TaxID=2954692 RepID=UPI0030F9BA83
MDALNGVKFSTVIKNSNYIVRDHRVHGVRIMPGVTLLDMIYRFLQTKGINLRDIELRKVLFSEPVSTSGQYDKKIQISFTKKADGYEVVAQSRKIKEHELLDSTWDENLRCELHLSPARAGERKSIDIQQIKSLSHRVEDMDHAYSYVRRIDIRHLEFMKGLGKLYYGDQRILAEITLGELAREYMDQFYMHPCYLDAATLVQGFVVLQELDFSRDIQASIPMFIESFRSYEPMKEQIYVYIKDEGYPDGDIKDLMYFDIEVYNGQGQEIASFRRWGLKKIRSRELISGPQKVQSPAASPLASPAPAKLEPVQVKAQSPLARTGVPAEEGMRKAAVTAYLKRLVSGLSGRDEAELRTDEGFYNQGLNSQHLLDIVKRLEEKLGSPLYPTLLFEYATMEELSQYILREHSDSFFGSDTAAGDVHQSDKPEPSAAAIHAYTSAWINSPLTEHSESGYPGQQEQVLVLCGQQDELLSLAGMAAGNRYTFVLPGEQFAAAEAGIYRMNFNRGDDYRQLADELQAADRMPTVLVNSLNCGGRKQGGLPESEQQVIPMFYILRELLRSRIKSAVKVLYFFDQEGAAAHPGDAAMEGFLHCIQSETDKVAYKCIGLDAENRRQLRTIFQDELYRGWDSGRRVVYERDIRRIQTYRKAGHVAGGGKTAIRSNQVYLITGGAGGIGQKLAAHVLQQGGTAILCGRAAKLPEEAAAGLGAHQRLDYVACDVTDRTSVERLHAFVKEKYGELDGIFHCAGLTRDSLLVHKDSDELRQVLRVKAEGTANLDEVFKGEPLTFFAAFSSVAGILGNPSQSDYAYANLYMDGYIQQRELWRAQGLRSGKSLSVNWPLWREGGMKGDEHTELALKHRFGISLLETSAGIEALEWALQREETLLLMVPGEESRIDAVLVRDGEWNEELHKETAATQPEMAPNPTIRSAGGTEEDDLAIIGISGRFPGADNLSEYWELLKAGRDAVSEVDPQRWSHEEQQRIARESWGKDSSRWGGFLRDVDKFDSLLFNVAPYQAVLMDPHERVFLELAWEAFEDGGYIRSELKGQKVGVFAGAMWMQYQLYNTSRQVSTSTLSSIANRVSYYFGLTGPSLGIDTMCSSSMTALHMACQSVKNQDCAMALVGGVNLSVHPDKYLLLSQGNFASSDGRCRSFGEGGDGYVPAEAAGAILIKPLKQAERDHDRIYAVIKGSAINHGGEASGFTVPNQRAQEEAVSEAIRRSGIDAGTINYIEAHGTGTSLGDPIEIKALMNAFAPHKDEAFSCAIGSVKSNIGHAEAAAGISSIAKVLLQMQHGQLVPSIHSERINPHIRLGNSGFYIQQKLEPWKPVTRTANGRTTVYPRRAGISAFGAGGSNAHVILEQYTGSRSSGNQDQQNVNNDPYIFILSAQTPERLQAYARRMKAFMEQRTTEGHGSHKDMTAALQEVIAQMLDLPVTGIGQDHSLEELGLGPVEFIQLCDRLLASFGIQANASAVSGDLTVEELSCQLVHGVAGMEGYEAAEVRAGAVQELSLPGLSYTLQVAREPMKHRLAVVYRTLSELLVTIGDYLEQRASAQLFTSEAGLAAQGQASKAQMQRHVQIQANPYTPGDAERLAQAWAEGAAIDWRTLYGNDVPELLSLPHYPFARKSYWIEPLNPSQLISTIQEYAEPSPTAGFAAPEAIPAYAGNEVMLEHVEGGVAIIRIQDAKHNNTFTHEVIQGLTHCFQAAQQDEQIKAIVVAGNERIFSMGGTQEQLLDISDSKLSFTDAPILYRGMLECPIPVISAMEGHASGGGLLFGLYADIVVMAEESLYSAAFAKYGFTPGMGATFILEDKLGKNLAVEMMFTAKMYSGEQLKSRSASVIFRAKDKVLQEAVSVARLIAEKPRTTVSVLKQELSSRVLDSLLQCVERENEMHRITFTTSEVKAKIRHLYRAAESGGNEREAVTAATLSAPEDKENKASLPTGGIHSGLTDHDGSAGLASSTDPADSIPSIYASEADRNIERNFKDELTRIIANRIQLDEAELDEDMNFKDMGVDSISGVEIVRDLNESFSLQLDTIDIYDYYSINLLAAHIGRKLGSFLQVKEAEVPGISGLKAVPAVSGTSSGTSRGAEEAGASGGHAGSGVSGGSANYTPPSVNQEDRDLLELLSRLNEDELDVDEVAQFLEVYYE